MSWGWQGAGAGSLPGRPHTGNAGVKRGTPVDQVCGVGVGQGVGRERAALSPADLVVVLRRGSVGVLREDAADAADVLGRHRGRGGERARGSRGDADLAREPPSRLGLVAAHLHGRLGETKCAEAAPILA